MTKQDFLEMLRLALNGRVAPGQVIENLQFYEDYINTEIRKGKSEETVLEELGDPRLIARTIAETGKQGQHTAGEAPWEREEYQPYEQSGQTHVRRFSKVPVWAWVALVLLIIVMILGAVFSLRAALLPILVPIFVVVFLVKAFRDWFQ